MKYIINSVFIVCFVAFNYAQTVEDILNNYKEKLKDTEHFYADISFSLFQDYESTIVLESLKGISAKKTTTFYSKIGPTEFVFSPEFTLKVSHAEKALVISDAALNSDILNGNMSLEAFDNFDVLPLKSLKDAWVCSFTPKTGAVLPYKRVDLYIDKFSYHILKQIIYFEKPLNHGYKNKAQYGNPQRLEIVFSNQQNKDIPIENEFLLNYYVNLNAQTYEAHKRIGDYNVINALTINSLKE